MRQNRKNDYLKVLIKIALIFSFVQSAAATPSCDLAKQVFPVVQKIRGLNFNGQVKCELHDKNQVLNFVTSEIQKEEVLKKAKNVELVLQSLKVIPNDFDYQKHMIQLYTSQIGGYYDPKSKKYVMASWMPDLVQPTVAAHELTHALQDKYYDLKKILDEEKFSSDEILARSALIEGDATMLMYDYVGSLVGQPQLMNIDSVEPYILQTVMGMYATGSSRNVPKLITSTLIFPYTSGFRFAHFLAKNEKSYKSIDKALKNPPKSTREILFPQQYISRITDRQLHQESELKISKFTNLVEQDSSKINSDTLGSFFLSNWLSLNNISSEEANYYASTLLADRVIISLDKSVKWYLLFDSSQIVEQFVQKVCPFIAKNELNCEKISKEGFLIIQIT